jgi:hypothetical protein
MALFDLHLGSRDVGRIAPISIAGPAGRGVTARSRRAGQADMSRPAFFRLVVAWAAAVGLLLVLALAIRWLA